MHLCSVSKCHRVRTQQLCKIHLARLADSCDHVLSSCVTSMELTRYRETNRTVTNGRRMTKPPKQKIIIPPQKPSPEKQPDPEVRTQSRASSGSLGGLLSNVPYSHPSASNVFGIGSEHPFANYWTCQGGLQEVILVLPDKLQADILLGRFFECVDPVYPMIHRQVLLLEAYDCTE